MVLDMLLVMDLDQDPATDMASLEVMVLGMEYMDQVQVVTAVTVVMGQVIINIEK